MGNIESNLVWLDLEMTGLDPECERIIEIALVVTNSDLEIVAEGPDLAIHQPNEILGDMDEWNTEHHSQSGLIDRVRESHIHEADAQASVLNFLQHYVLPGKSPLCGNSIHQDRRFLYRYMPDLEKYFHYRNLDVSTIKILAQMWAPDILAGMSKISQHRALQDVYDSINELRYYREHFFKK